MQIEVAPGVFLSKIRNSELVLHWGANEEEIKTRRLYRSIGALQISPGRLEARVFSKCIIRKRTL